MSCSAPQAQLVLVYDPSTLEVWGWSERPAQAEAMALRRMRALDAAHPPEADEEPAAQLLARCERLRVEVARPQLPDLCALLGLRGD